uniref:PDZ domain-containing protein n=1 Tax=Hucho hucho TaxID=62062 RepID=A0A4W5LBN7_9TELE
MHSSTLFIFVLYTDLSSECCPLSPCCSHINQKTQFENPVLEAKRKLSLDTPSPDLQGVNTPSDEPVVGVRGFVRDPAHLQGSILRTNLRKSPQGFGFTIIGGDRHDEFLQVKNVLRDGPAAHDNKITSGDVIVDINGLCVLGKTHADVVQMFQSIPVNQYVDMVLCRGYPLPEDPSGSDDTSSWDVATALAPEPTPSLSTSNPQEIHYVTSPDGTLPRQVQYNQFLPRFLPFREFFLATVLLFLLAV